MDRRLQPPNGCLSGEDESLQEVPIALTAFAGDYLRDAGLKDIPDLVFATPGISGSMSSNYMVSCELDFRLAQFGGEFPTERVQALRAVQGDDCDAAAFLVGDIGHFQKFNCASTPNSRGR